MKGWMILLAGIALLFANRKGYIRFTFRASLYIWLIIFGGLVMMLSGD